MSSESGILQTIVETTTKCLKHASKKDNANDLAHNYHHDQHAESNLHDGMIMSFHVGYKETILFEFWKTETLSFFLVSCLILFVGAFLYEGLKLAREILIRHELVTSRLSSSLLENSTVNYNKECCCNNYPSGTKCQQCKITNENKFSEQVTFKSYRMSLFSRGHLLQTLLHMLQITVSYLLMLVFMTYNVWLCLSVVVGAALGFFVFGTQRLTSIEINENCH